MDVRGDTVWDGEAPFAVLEPEPDRGGDAVSVRPITPALIRLPAATALVDALTRSDVTTLVVGDELVRAQARAAGWTGGLRQPLATPATTATVDDDPVAAVATLLPGIVVERRGRWRRGTSLRATTADGLHMSVKVAERPDVVPELLAAALDTAFAIRRRFGRTAAGVHAISIDDGAGGFDDHSTLGSAQSGTGTFFLDSSLACLRAIDDLRERWAGRRPVSAVVGRPWFVLDGVVAHEYWHNLDGALLASPATYLEFYRELGEELGVDTFEHALRGGGQGAPIEWQHAFQRILQEVSRYATTNIREATAELFKLWWCGSTTRPASPLVTRFGALVDRYLPLSS